MSSIVGSLLSLSCNSTPSKIVSRTDPLRSPISKDHEKNLLPTPPILPPTKWQTTFNVEEPVTHPLIISQGILDSIRKSDRPVPQTCFETPTECFVASSISINTDEFVDVLVMGQGVLLGANITPFWVLQGTPSGFQPVLSASAFELVIGDDKDGSREIYLVSLTAEKIITKTFRLSGEKYELVELKEEDI